MKIATWNVERLKHEKDIKAINEACEDINADVLVLTESDERIHLSYRYCFHTPTPPDLFLPQYGTSLRYKGTEHRVSIFTNYECIQLHPTFNEYTALCAELNTECGALLFYGTIMGVLGNREASFKKDLSEQLEDFKRLSSLDRNLCILGDYNYSFGDNYYFTAEGREKIMHSFASKHITIVTARQQNCIDHIALSDGLLDGKAIKIMEWNVDKNLSDHKGICVEF